MTHRREAGNETVRHRPGGHGDTREEKCLGVSKTGRGSLRYDPEEGRDTEKYLWARRLDFPFGFQGRSVRVVNSSPIKTCLPAVGSSHERGTCRNATHREHVLVDASWRQDEFQFELR